MMAEPKPQPVNMRVKLFSQLCDEADRADLKPGEVKPRDSYPVYDFSGRQFYEGNDGKIKGKP